MFTSVIKKIVVKIFSKKILVKKKKKPTCNAGDLGSIPESGRSPGEENGNPLHYSCLENPMPTVHGVTKSRTQLSD